MIAKVQSALKHFYGEINATNFIDLVGIKTAKDLINFFEILKMHPSDKKQANLADVLARASIHLNKRSTPLKYQRIGDDLSREVAEELKTAIMVTDSFVRQCVKDKHGNLSHIKNMDFIKMFGGVS